MADYTQNTFFSPKDSLISGDPAKRIRGSDIDAEFVEIQSAISTKEDKSSKNQPSGYVGLDASQQVPRVYLPQANELLRGTVELATVEEATTGTDTERAVTPAGLKAAMPVVVSYSVQKSANTSVTNTIDYALDPHLVTPSVVAGVYDIDAVLDVLFPALSVGGFGFSLAGGTATLRNDATLDASSTSTVWSFVGGGAYLAFARHAGGDQNSGGAASARFLAKARVVVTSPGTIGLQWAQGAASGTTTLVAGSWMTVRKVG